MAVYKPIATSKQVAVYKPIATSKQMAVYKPIATSKQMAVYKPIATSKQMAVYKPIATSKQMDVYKPIATSKQMIGHIPQGVFTDLKCLLDVCIWANIFADTKMLGAPGHILRSAWLFYLVNNLELDHQCNTGA